MKWTDIAAFEGGTDVRNKLNAALEFATNPPVHDTSINYAINGSTDKYILVTTGAGDIIITMPDLAGIDYENNTFIIIKVDDGVGRVIINGYGTDQIMGQDFVTIAYQWEIYKLLKHSTLWIPIY